MSAGEERGAAAQIGSTIGYHGYLLSLCFMDARWSRWSGRVGAQHAGADGFEPFHETIEAFTTRCCHYRDQVRKNYIHYRQANRKHKSVGRAPTSVKDTGKGLARYLFNPACYVPFGHADVLGIVLVDDSDPVYFPARFLGGTDEPSTEGGGEVTIESMSVAFCPDLDSLDVERRDLLTHAHELFEQASGPVRRPTPVSGAPPAKDDASGRPYRPAEHGFQKKAPLVAFTRFKTNGLMTLGQRLLFQQELYKAMAKRMTDTKAVMLDHAKTVESPESGLRPLITSSDVEATRVVFLDLLGAEEVGVLIFCTNYSVAMGLICACRSLQLGDLFRTDTAGHLKRVLRSNSLLVDLIPRAGQEGASDPAEALKANHVFLWTQTLTGVSTERFIGPGHENCGGWVDAVSEIQISPGHKGSVDPHVSDSLAPSAPAGSRGERLLPLEGFRQYQVGTGDLTVDLRATRGRPETALLPLPDVLDRLVHDIRRFAVPNDGRSGRGRDVVDITTYLSVPFPIIDEAKWPDGVEWVYTMPDKDSGHFAPLGRLLPQAQRRLCLTVAREYGPESGKLSLPSLKHRLREYGLPLSLRRSIEHLFQDFATLLADPFLFEMVLDLYDSFLALHATLTCHLPELRKRQTREGIGYGRAYLRREHVEQLSMMADAIQSALSYRIAKAYPESQVRDTAMVFRCGFQQILLGAEAVVKCGLGLLRRVVDTQGRGRGRVGAPIRVSFVPGARSCSLCLGTEHEATLAFYDVDLPHMLHVPSYFDLLHESFHLVRHGMRAQPGPDGAEEMSRTMRQRLDEIFADLLCLILVFERDIDAFCTYYVSDYSRSADCICDREEDTFILFGEAMARLLLIIRAMPDDCAIYDLPGRPMRPRLDPAQAAKAFEKLLTRYGPLFSEYDRLRKAHGKQEELRRVMRQQFLAAYTQTMPHMGGLWSQAMTVVEKYIERGGQCLEDQQDGEAEAIVAAINEGFDSGRPPIRCVLPVPPTPRATRRPDEASEGVDTLALMSNMLHQYARRFGNWQRQAIHLVREGRERRVKYPTGDRRWFDFQLDHGAVAFFSPVPSSRRQRLQHYIVLAKTFADIASSLRARRLRDILRDNIPAPS